MARLLAEPQALLKPGSEVLPDGLISIRGQESVEGILFLQFYGELALGDPDVFNACFKSVPEAFARVKPILEGMSRGGLIVFNWAKQNPDKITAIYTPGPR